MSAFGNLSPFVIICIDIVFKGFFFFFSKKKKKMFVFYSEGKDDTDSGPTEVFFFPTSMMGAAMEDVDAPESALKLPSPSSPHREITVQTSSCGSLASSTNSENTEHYSADEEFCIIDDPGLGIVVCSDSTFHYHIQGSRI